MKVLEMINELMKDNSKRFSVGEPFDIMEEKQIVFVDADNCIMTKYEYEDDYYAETFQVFCDDYNEYEEIVTPLWEVIREEQLYYFAHPIHRDGIGVTSYCAGCSMDDSNRDRHNMFRTIEEAKEKFEEILKVLK